MVLENPNANDRTHSVTFGLGCGPSRSKPFRNVSYTSVGLRTGEHAFRLYPKPVEGGTPARRLIGRPPPCSEVSVSAKATRQTPDGNVNGVTSTVSSPTHENPITLYISLFNILQSPRASKFGNRVALPESVHSDFADK